MIKDTKVQFVRDVTWGDLTGAVNDGRDKSEIIIPIWTVGYTTGNVSQGWTQIRTRTQPAYLYPDSAFEVVIAPTQQ